MRRTLLEKFKVDELKELLRERSQRISGNKAELVERFFSSQPRATDKQIEYMYHLKQRDFRLVMEPQHVATKVMAMKWIADAKQKDL